MYIPLLPGLSHTCLGLPLAPAAVCRAVAHRSALPPQHADAVSLAPLCWILLRLRPRRACRAPAARVAGTITTTTLQTSWVCRCLPRLPLPATDSGCGYAAFCRLLNACLAACSHAAGFRFYHSAAPYTRHRTYTRYGLGCASCRYIVVLLPDGSPSFFSYTDAIYLSCTACLRTAACRHIPAASQVSAIGVPAACRRRSRLPRLPASAVRLRMPACCLLRIHCLMPAAAPVLRIPLFWFAFCRLRVHTLLLLEHTLPPPWDTLGCACCGLLPRFTCRLAPAACTASWMGCRVGSVDAWNIWVHRRRRGITTGYSMLVLSPACRRLGDSRLGHYLSHSSLLSHWHTSFLHLSLQVYRSLRTKKRRFY